MVDTKWIILAPTICEIICAIPAAPVLYMYWKEYGRKWASVASDIRVLELSECAEFVDGPAGEGAVVVQTE